jgi:hypothetical protein
LVLAARTFPVALAANLNSFTYLKAKPADKLVFLIVNPRS